MMGTGFTWFRRWVQSRNQDIHRYTPQAALEREYRRMLEKEKGDAYEG